MSEKEIKQDSTVSTNAVDKANTRRSFFKKAALGSAFITTVTSRPVWAGTCSLSGNLSNNTSDNHNIHPLDCEIKGYSPGGWTNGHAFKNGLWGDLNRSLSDPLNSILPAYNGSATIEEALTGDGPNPVITVDSGLWRQRAAAALNSILWVVIKSACQSDPNCVYLSNTSPISDEFYYTWTISEIMNKTEAALSTANNAL